MIWGKSPTVVRVPATSANLGPGFDAFGLALALYDEVEARVTDGGLAVAVRGEGEQTAGAGERHLVVRAMRAAFDAMGGQPGGLALRCTNRIPHGRGLGSSAAAVVSGILAARALVADGADRLPGAEVLRLAVELEGHPDNVAACLAGGLTVAWQPAVAGGNGAGPGGAGAGLVPTAGVVPPERGRGAAGPGAGGLTGGGPGDHGGPGDGGPAAGAPGNGASAAGAPGNEAPGGRPAVGAPGRRPVRLLRLDVLDAITAVVCVAPTAMATHEARLALPASVPHADAAANAARSALLLAALTSAPAVLFDATEDYLHQSYRAAAMPQTADLLARLRRAGIAAVVSGAGPSILALGLAGERPSLAGERPGLAGKLPGLAAVDSIARETGIAWRVTPLKVDRQGATVQPGGTGAPRSAAARQGRSTNQAPDPGVLPAEGSTQGRAANPATHGPQSRECRGLLWC